MLSDYQRSNFYRAKVISLDDPLNLNRIQISIFGLTDDMPNENQPWCELQFTAGFSTSPIEGDIIWLFFEGGDIFRPVYLGTIYAGTNIDSEIGYEKFAAYLDAKKESGMARGVTSGYDFTAVKNIPTYRTALRTANNVDTDKQLSMKDTISHYDVLTPESTWWRKFEGLDVVSTANTSTNQKYQTFGSRDSQYGASPIPSGQKVYPWYELREQFAAEDWKSIYGGWRFLTEDDLKKGKAYFPDNLRRTYLKRYKSWIRWFMENPQIVSWTTDVNMYAGVAPNSWDFIPLPPTIYYDPEMSLTSLWKDSAGKIYPGQEKSLRQTKSFPFGKMKIKNRKHYKQSSWLSYDGKSAIEIDDNDNYERLKIDFNYGEGGLEFSRAGWRGVELWTEGAFKIRGWGRAGNGKGGTSSVGNSIEGIDSDLYVLCDKFYGCGGTTGASMGSSGPAEVKSKLSTVSIVGAKGITLMSSGGLDASRGEVNSDNEGTSAGAAVIAGTGSSKGVDSTGLNGWIPFLNNKSESDAKGYYESLNASVLMVKKLAETVSMATTPPITIVGVIKLAFNIYNWAKGAKSALLNIGGDNHMDTVAVQGSWKGITIEGGSR